MPGSMSAKTQDWTLKAHKTIGHHRSVRRLLCRALKTALSRNTTLLILLYTMSFQQTNAFCHVSSAQDYDIYPHNVALSTSPAAPYTLGRDTSPCYT